MEKSRTLPQVIHPAPAGAELSVTRGQRSDSDRLLATCGDGKETSSKEEIMPSPHPAPAGAELSVTRVRR